MNILLIAPHACPCCTVIAPSMPLLLLQQALRKQGLDAEIFTPFLDDTTLCLQKAADGAYDMVVFSLFFSTIKDDLRFFDAIKQRLPQNTPVIAEGMLAAHAIEHCLALGFDAVLAGYAPFILGEVCAALAQAPERHLRELRVDGLAHADAKESSYRISSAQYKALAHDAVLTLDIPYERFWDVVQQRIPFLNHGPNKYTLRTARIETSICCHGSCGFCATEYRKLCKKEERRSAYALSPAHMLDLVLRPCADHTIETIVFTDVDFFHDTGRVREFCHLVMDAKKKGELPHSLAFYAQTRAVHCILDNGEPDVDLLTTARKAGFAGLTLGVETFNQRILEMPALNKGQCTDLSIKKLFDVMLSLRLTPQCNFIFLQPDATADEVVADIETMFTLVDKGVTCAGQPIMYATPGAPILNNPAYAFTQCSLSSSRGETVYPEYIIPQDARCAAAAAHYKPVLAQERQRLRLMSGWPYEEFSRTLDALLMGIALVRTLGDTTRADNLLKKAAAFAARD